jgi:hypothetical protein
MAQPVSLRDGGRRGIFQDVVITRIDARITFNAFGIHHLAIKVKDLAADIDALGTGYRHAED